MSGRSPQTRRQKVAERELAIVRAAREVFQKHGFEKARIVEIAKRAGVAEGTVYLYFENKNALMLAVLSAFYERLTREAADGIRAIDGTAERLAFLARHHLDSVGREWPMLGLAITLYRFQNDYGQTETYRLNRTYVAVFDQVIREGIIRGEIRDDLPLGLLRDVFYGSMEYTVRTTKLRRPAQEADTAALTADFMRLLTAGIFQGPATAATERAPDLRAWQTVATRLETAVARMEAVSAKADGDAVPARRKNA